jgi:mannose-6-phosphate isomerase
MLDRAETEAVSFADAAVYPVRLRPVYKDYLWGGDRIARRYGRTGAPAVCAESWELCDRVESSSEVVNGPLAGQTLRRLLTEGLAPAFYGSSGRFPFFPVICKILDARQRLSVQVHPPPAVAAELGAEPKSEMWVILDADPGARVYIGLQPDTNEAALRTSLKDGTVARLLTPHAVVPGDAFSIPAGTVHAVGEGCLIYEVQQNSTTTYRLFDWNRLAAGGRPRELHVEQALRSIAWGPAVSPRLASPRLTWLNFRLGASIRQVLDTPFFRIERLTLPGLCPCATQGETPHVLFVEKGRIVVDSARDSLPVPAGGTVLIPAGVREYGLAADGGPAVVLRTSLPGPDLPGRASTAT